MSPHTIPGTSAGPWYLTCPVPVQSPILLGQGWPYSGIWAGRSRNNCFGNGQIFAVEHVDAHRRSRDPRFLICLFSGLH